MPAGFLLKGAVIGFSIAAPVGPIGILCVRRSLHDGQRAGLVTGLGAATADACYGALAAFGVTAVSSLLIASRFWLGILGGAFLCFLGIRTFLGRSPEAAGAHSANGGLLAAYLSTLLLTLANPMTILSFLAIFAGLGLGRAPDYRSAGMVVAGVFLGSALWWLILSSAAALWRRNITPRGMRALNRLAAALITAFGVLGLMSAWRR